MKACWRGHGSHDVNAAYCWKCGAELEEVPPGGLNTPGDMDGTSSNTVSDVVEWICATIDFLVTGESATSLEAYVSRPTLARKAKDKVRNLGRVLR